MMFLEAGEPFGVVGGVTDVTMGAVDVETFYLASYQRLVGILTLAANSREDAEEVVQEAFVRLLGRWAKISQYDDPEAWVRAVAFRLLSNRFRKSRNRRIAHARILEPEHVEAHPSVDPDLLHALSRLPIAQRQVVVMHYLLDLDVAQVAIQLKIAPGTVKSRLSRARSALEPMLSEETHV